MGYSDCFVYVSADEQEVTICGDTLFRNKVPGMRFSVCFGGVTIYPNCTTHVRIFDFDKDDASVSFSLVPAVHEPYTLGDNILKHG